MKKNIIICVSVALILFGGCAQKAPELDSTLINTSVPSSASWGAGSDNGAKNLDSHIDSMAGMASSSQTYSSRDEMIQALESELKPIYFGSDKYSISMQEQEKIDADASVLNGDMASSFAVKIVGNCDEFGTDEYNYGLGLKRAKSTKDALMVAGVDSARMAVTTEGEANPVCTDSTAECWQRNRRADIELLP